jgi:hypothetical protein
MEVPKILKRINEYLPLIIALVVWLLMTPILNWIDPSAGTDDLGLLQALIFGLVIYYAATAFSWIALRLVFPRIGNYVDNVMKYDFSDFAKVEHKMWFSLAMFAMYFFGAIIVFASVL